MILAHALGRSALFVLALLQGAAQSATDPKRAAEELSGIERRIEEHGARLRAQRKQATSAEARAALAAAFPRDELVAELSALALASKGSEIAARAWLDVFRVASLLDERELYERALERLLAEHATSPQIHNLTLELVYGAPPWSAPLAADALRTILAKNERGALRPGALTQLALLVGLDERFGAQGRAEALALLARIEAEFGDQDFLGMTGRQFAAGARFEIEHLRVGQVAPEFELPDQDGVSFKLSDSLGRVVVLDFWGFV